MNDASALREIAAHLTLPHNIHLGCRLEEIADRMDTGAGDSIYKIVSERDMLRQKNDLLLLVTGWLIGEGLKHGHPPPQEVIEMLAGIGITLYK